MGSGPTTRSRSALRSTPHLDHRPGPQPRSEGQVQQLGTSSNSQTAEAEAAESAYLRTALHNAINACDRPAINRFRRTLEPSIFEILVRASSASNRIKSRVLTDGLYPHEEKYLEDARSSVPRFLFRGSHPGSGGGKPGLNSVHGIIPHAFLEGHAKASLYDYPRPELRKLINGHLNGRHNDTPFSLWTADLYTASFFGSDHNKLHECFMAVVDTRVLLRTVAAYHAPQLYLLGLANAPYAREYLLYGRTEGEGFTAMPWQTSWCWHVERMIPGGDRAHSLTYFAEQMERAVGLARSAGGRFVLPLAAALFAFWNSKRGYTLIWPGDASPSFDTAAELQGLFRVDDDFVCVVLEALQGLDVPRELDGDSAPMFDTAYWHGFPQVRVWIYLLRMIVVARWRRGRGWAGRPITRRGIDGV